MKNSLLCLHLKDVIKMKIIKATLSIALLATSALALSSTAALAHNHKAEQHKMDHHADKTALDMALSSQTDEVKKRYQYRHPKETLTYFGITPGMTVAEVLPGGGWYSKVLLPYLGPEGKLVGVDYSYDMWKVWRGDNEKAAKFLAERKTWTSTWTEEAKTWTTKDSAAIDAFSFGAVPKQLNGTIDAFLWVRAIHHLGRFEDKGQYRMPALKEMYTALKPGGIVGIVQHRAPEESDDAWAIGKNGYIKQSAVIANMKAAGFELVGTSEINANALDKPTNEDFVWRLPPSFATSKDDVKKHDVMAAIGESDRMTLKFRKPK